MCSIVVASLFHAPPRAYAAGSDAPRVPVAGEAPRGKPGKVLPRKESPTRGATVTTPQTVTWPTAGAGDVSVGGPGANVRGLQVKLADGREERATPPVPGRAQAAAPAPVTARVRVTVHNRAAAHRAGVSGPILTLKFTDARQPAGPVNITIGYRDFEAAYGGDFGARLRVARLPSCAVATPERGGCRTPEVLPTTNDPKTRTLTVRTSLPQGEAIALALTAADASAQGTYAATKLSPSSSWSVAASSGVFRWSYPLRTPPVPGGFAPDVALGYSSQAVDGMSPVTNNQGSWIGDGFAYEPGYIERRYQGCSNDGHPTSGDLCWAMPNATMVFNGRSGVLVKVSENLWKLSSDDGSKVERVLGATNDDNDGEHWKVTTTDGTQYFFGLGRLPGWSTNKEETKSAWTVPVFGDDDGEPCYRSSGFADSACDQAWRWNLDYAVDIHGNTVAYYYDRETNHYARNGRTDVNGAAYHRGGYLRRIDYGQRAGQVYSTNAPVRVRFTVLERCLPSGAITCAPAELTEANAAYWPDVPFDRNCDANTHCRAEQASPTFWTRKRLTKVETEFRQGAGWSLVDSWLFAHEFADNSDGSRSLWLSQITRAGHLGGDTITMPAIRLLGEQKANRVAPDAAIPALNRHRLTTIHTESGGQIDIAYAAPDCVGALPLPGQSTRRCFPARWKNAVGTWVTDWYHKYVVQRVTSTDRTGGNPDMVTRYEYVGDAAWRKTEPDGITKLEDLTWSDWRGYGKVIAYGGTSTSQHTKVEHTYLRGMDGGTAPDGSTLSVNVTDSTGVSHVDRNQWSGHELEAVVFDGPSVVSKRISKPWLHVTHTQSETWGTRYASLVRTQETRGLTALPAVGGVPQWREAKTVVHHDTTWGRVLSVDDLADIATPTDDRCARTSYADNPGAYLYGLPAVEETFAVACSVNNPDRATTLLSSKRSTHNGTADLTKTESLKSATTTTTEYRLQSESTTVDEYGRSRVVKNATGDAVTQTFYETDGLTTKVETVNALDHKTTTELDPATGLVTATIDPNSYRTDQRYDALGRLVAVWQAHHTKAGHPNTPNVRYSYLYDVNKPVVVKTETITNVETYRASYQVFDGFLRLRQTQRPGPDGTWLLTDTTYTGTGQVARTTGVYRAIGTPGGAPIVTASEALNGHTSYVYDGADRAVASVFGVGPDERYRTTLTFEGDRVHTDPPAGATPTTAVSDARGQTTELREYLGSGPTGSANVTSYSYHPAGTLAKVTDTLGNEWSYRYNQEQQRIEFNDPDSGRTTYTYDEQGRVKSATDARQNTLSYVYDKLSRQTQLWRGEPVAGPGNTKLAEWSYDGLWKGQLYWSARYVDGKSYGIVYDQRDALYRLLRARYVLPAEAGAELAGSYEFTTAYNLDGTTRSSGAPAAGGLPAEVLVPEYDELLRPTKLSGATSYVTETSYGPLNELNLAELFAGGTGKRAWLSWTFDRGTRRFATASLHREGRGGLADMDSRYTYDDAGNLRAIADTPAGGARDIQCFTYDSLRRLRVAWTTASEATDPCAGGPSTSGVGGPAPYHLAWDIDGAGNRTKETSYTTAGAVEFERTYTYPGAGSAQPHTLRQVSDQRPSGTTTNTYAYDAGGNTRRREVGGQVQDLAWDAEGHLASLTANNQTTSFIYDADGKRLLRKEQGATTLYLPGMELRLDHTTRQVKGTRFYTFSGVAIAVRNSTGLFFQASDHHKTAQHSINAQTGAISTRRTTPYGGPRGSQPSAWHDDKGFVGGTKDPATGLTQLGAREYDPDTGRFISVDPIIKPLDPQQLNGYAYGHNSPATFSDPSGLDDCADNDCTVRSPSYKRVVTLELDSFPVEDKKGHRLQLWYRLWTEDDVLMLRVCLDGSNNCESRVYGKHVTCQSPNQRGHCYVGQDGYVYDLGGTRSCSKHNVRSVGICDVAPPPKLETTTRTPKPCVPGPAFTAASPNLIPIEREDPRATSTEKGFTAGICASGGVAAIFGAEGELCLHFGRENMGLTFSRKASAGFQAGGGGDVGLSFSNAKYVHQLGGMDATFKVAGHAGLGGGVEYADNLNGTKSVSVDFGVGAEVAVAPGYSDTDVLFTWDYKFW